MNKLITERYSVRNFKSEHLPQEVIDKIFEVGHKAPTGCNYRPQRIFVLANRLTEYHYEKWPICYAIVAVIPLVLHIIPVRITPFFHFIFFIAQLGQTPCFCK